MKLLLIFLLMSSISFSNTKHVKLEESLVNNFKEISFFVEENHQLIQDLINVHPKKIQRLIKKVKIAVVSEDLYDRYGLKRDALNFPKKKLIVFNRKVLIENMKKPQSLYIILLHELFGLLEIELNKPEELRQKNYEFSSLIALQMINPGVMTYKSYQMVEVPYSFCSESAYHGYRYQCIQKYSGKMIDVRALQVCALTKDIIEKKTCIDQISGIAYTDRQIDICKDSDDFLSALQCFMDARTTKQLQDYILNIEKHYEMFNRRSNRIKELRFKKFLKTAPNNSHTVRMPRGTIRIQRKN